MNCPNCHSSNPDGTRFCMNCGAPLKEATPAASKPKKRPGKLLLWLLVGVFALAAVMLLLARAGVFSRRPWQPPEELLPEAHTQQSPETSEPSKPVNTEKASGGKKAERPQEQSPESGPESETDPGFSALEGDWYEEAGESHLLVYENGGFELYEPGGYSEGYLVYTDKDGGMWESGPRWQMFLEDNSRLYESAYLCFDDNHPGTLTFAYGGGAQLFVRDAPESELTPINLQAIYLEDAPWLTSYDIFVAEHADYSVQIVFTVDRAVREFEVLAIATERVNEDGTLDFSEVLRHSQPQLTPGTPLVVELVFYGTFPNNAVAYLDEDGIRHVFVLNVSGEDGSLLLQEALK